MGRLRGEGGGGEASDGGQDLVSRFCPTERFGLLVMGSDELPDSGFQFLNRFCASHALICRCVSNANQRSTWLTQEAWWVSEV